ncbi:major facilitator superfamily domain-containing protein [Aspergillus pseudodeflectus]|uniref:Major facilitator superfamily domain-containing protein n=1 Tax=Aspergillus pseudodeflectus TaxID=176178 RepID=A0ABR4KGC4_9EURO
MDAKHSIEESSRQPRTSSSNKADIPPSSSSSSSSSSSLVKQQTNRVDSGPQQMSDEPSKSAEVAESDTPAPEEWISGIPLFMVVSGVTLVVFLMLLDTSIVATAVPKITNHFHSLQDVAWYGSAYTLASCALQPLTGKFYTHFKSKVVFLSFFLLFEVGSLISGVANSSKMLIIGRAISGMGTSGMVNGALTIIAGSVPMHKRPALIGIMMGLAQLGLVLGPLIGGVLTDKASWRWCFYINLPIGGLVAVLLLFTRVPEQRKKGRAVDVLPTFFKSFDLIGFVLFAPAAIMILLALEYGGNDYPWSDSRVIGLFVGGGATAIVFLAWEYRTGKDAMIPFHLITQRVAYFSYLNMCVLFGLTMVIAYYIPIYFQAVKGDSALTSGVNMLPNILAQLVTAVASGLLIGKLGFYIPWAIGGAIFCAVGTGLLSMLSPTTVTAAWAGYQIILGLGRGTATQAPMLAVQSNISPDDVSTAMAILTFSQTFGGSIFLAIANVIFTAGLRDQIPQYAPNVNPENVIAKGATGFRDVIAAEDLAGVLRGYAKAVDWTLYLAAALCVVQFASSWGLGWKDVRKKEVAEESVKENGGEKDVEKGVKAEA